MKLQFSACFSLLLEFLENSWKFEIFFQGPRKLRKKQIVFLYSWKPLEFCAKKFHQFYKQTFRSIWLMVVLFVFYVDSVSVFATVAEITWYRFVFAEREFRFGPSKSKFSTLENSWKTPGILLSSLSEHHDCVIFSSSSNAIPRCSSIIETEFILQLLKVRTYPRRHL